MTQQKEMDIGEQEDEEVLDPDEEDGKDEVEEVDAGTSKYATKRLHQGAWHYFCGLLCRMKFTGNPVAYLKAGDKP